MADLEQQINHLSFNTVWIASVVLIVGAVLARVFKDNKRLKLPLFLLMAGAVAASTLTLFGSTIYLNTKSESKGPVHWHADIEFWACGVEIELRDPQGALSNKIGTTTFHEHNDKRIHLEGVVVRKAVDASLVKFMSVTGGYLASDRIAIPLNEKGDDAGMNWFANAQNDKLDGDEQKTGNFPVAIGGGEWITQTDKSTLLVLQNGQPCPSTTLGVNGGQSAELQVFVYSFNKDDKTYSQSKLPSPTDYVMRDESVVPPGDCVIIEFDTPKNRTDKLCRQYGVRDQDRCEQFGVKEFDVELCNIREVSGGIN